MTRRQLAAYYFHNDYTLAAATEEIQAIYPDVTREWIAAVQALSLGLDKKVIQLYNTG